jgi:hypothetical protein
MVTRVALLPKMESLVTALEAPPRRLPKYSETPLYPVRKWLEKSAGFQSG